MLKVCIDWERPELFEQSVGKTRLARPLTILLTVCLLWGCGAKQTTTKPTVKEVVVAEAKKVPAKPIYTPQQEQAFTRALEQAKGGQHAEAKTAFLSLVETAPEMTGAWVNLGFLVLSEGKNQAEASEYFNRALSQDSDNAFALLGLSELDTQDGKFEAAARKLDQAIQVKPDYWVAHYKVGVLYDLYLGEKDKALEHYREYVKGSNDEDVELVKNWIRLLELELQ